MLTLSKLLVAAAEPVGDPDLVLLAAERIGITSAIGETDGLLTIAERVTFRHPLVRRAVGSLGTEHSSGQRSQVPAFLLFHRRQ